MFCFPSLHLVTHVIVRLSLLIVRMVHGRSTSRCVGPVQVSRWLEHLSMARKGMWIISLGSHPNQGERWMMVLGDWCCTAMRLHLRMNMCHPLMNLCPLFKRVSGLIPNLSTMTLCIVWLVWVLLVIPMSHHFHNCWTCEETCVTMCWLGWLSTFVSWQLPNLLLSANACLLLSVPQSCKV